MTRGVFLAIEGPRGVGKTTHARALAAHLGAFYAEEPTGNLPPKLGPQENRRAAGWRPGAVEAFSIEIEARLAAGEHVVCDRWLLSRLCEAICTALKDIPHPESAYRSEEEMLFWRFGAFEQRVCVPDELIRLEAPLDVLHARCDAADPVVPKWLRGETIHYWAMAPLGAWLRLGEAFAAEVAGPLPALDAGPDVWAAWRATRDATYASYVRCRSVTTFDRIDTSASVEETHAKVVERARQVLLRDRA